MLFMCKFTVYGEFTCFYTKKILSLWESFYIWWIMDLIEIGKDVTISFGAGIRRGWLYGKAV